MTHLPSSTPFDIVPCIWVVYRLFVPYAAPRKENFSILSKSISLDKMHIASCPDISSGGGGRGGAALGNSNSELESEDFLVCWFWKHCFVWTLGRGWDTEDVNFCICTLVLSEPITLRSTQPLKVSTRDLSWGKGGWCVWLTIYHPCSAEISRKFGTLIYPEPLGPHRPDAGDLHFTIYITRLASNEIFSPSYRIHREVSRGKDLSAPLYLK